jgi:hypothetical protein
MRSKSTTKTRLPRRNITEMRPAAPEGWVEHEMAGAR